MNAPIPSIPSVPPTGRGKHRPPSRVRGPRPGSATSPLRRSSLTWTAPDWSPSLGRRWFTDRAPVRSGRLLATWADPSGVLLALVAIIRGGNGKTGPMVQTYVVRLDLAIREVIAMCADSATCGDCPHSTRFLFDCYVLKGGKARLALGSVARVAQEGRYPAATLEETRELAENASVRLGTYGETPLAPFPVVEALASGGKGTGYTHLWRVLPADPWARWLMASVESEEEAKEAMALGWRTFRPRPATSPILPFERQCPAAREAGHRVTCADCLACNGKKSRDDDRPGRTIITH